MARRLTAREVCNLFVMELKVEDDDEDQEKCIEIEDSTILEGVDDELIDETEVKNQHMTGANGADNDDDGNNRQPSWTSFIRD